MTRLFSSIIFASLLIISSMVTAQSTPQPFTFTAIPDQDEAHLQERFNKIAVYLEKQLGIEVLYIPVKSYAAAVTAFRNNQVQLAWFGGLSGVQARRLVPGSRAIAQGYEDPFFKPTLSPTAAVAWKSSTDFPEAIAGKTFTFGSKGSTSGRLMPEYHIRQQLSIHRRISSPRWALAATTAAPLPWCSLAPIRLARSTTKSGPRSSQRAKLTPPR